MLSTSQTFAFTGLHGSSFTFGEFVVATNQGAETSGEIKGSLVTVSTNNGSPFEFSSIDVGLFGTGNPNVTHPDSVVFTALDANGNVLATYTADNLGANDCTRRHAAGLPVQHRRHGLWRISR